MRLSMSAILEFIDGFTAGVGWSAGYSSVRQDKWNS